MGGQLPGKEAAQGPGVQEEAGGRVRGVQAQAREFLQRAGEREVEAGGEVLICVTV